MEKKSIFYGLLTFPLPLMVHALRQWPTPELIALIGTAVRARLACVAIAAATILSFISLRLGADVPKSIGMGLLVGFIALAIGVLITKLLDSVNTPLVWGVCEKVTRIVARDRRLDPHRKTLDAVSNFRLKGNRESWQRTMQLLNDVLYPSSLLYPPSWARRRDAYQCVIPFLIAPMIFLAVAIGLFFIPGSDETVQYLDWLAGSIPIVGISSWIIGAGMAR